jgi:hypothetical protein
MTTFGYALMDRFRGQAGRSWSHLAEAIPAGVVPHHSFHVFHVYPWVGLLGHGRGEPLEVLHQCRIRWGQVVSVERDAVIVRSQPLRYDQGRLYLGPEGGVEPQHRAGPGSVR